MTQVARVRQASSILPDALVRDLRSRTGRETGSIKEHYETGCVETNGDAGDAQRGAERSEYEKHSETRASELANMHYKLISN